VRRVGCALLVCFLGASLLRCAVAQTFEFLPEVNAYYKVKSAVRLSFQAKQTRENGDPTQVELGPTIDFMTKPWGRLRNASRYDQDDSKNRGLALAFVYRYLPSPDAPTVNRLIFVATPNFPLRRGVLLTDRNRGELNFSSKGLDWRYRNRLNLQRTFDVHSYHPIPYASAEFYYDSKYQKWSSTALYAGCRFPVVKHVQLDPYYEHENNTGKKPNQQVHAFGVALGITF